MPTPTPEDVDAATRTVGGLIGGALATALGWGGFRALRRGGQGDGLQCVVDAIREEGEKTREVLSKLSERIAVLSDRVHR